MKFTHVIGFLAFASLAVQADEEAAPRALNERLIELAGESSRNCGAIPLGSDYQVAFACAKRSNASGAAFRVVRQLRGTDSYIWEAAARGENGRTWVLFYDSDPSGGSGASPILGASECKNLRFSNGGKADLECDGEVNEP